MRKIIMFVVSVAIPVLLGAIVSNLIPMNVDYDSLNKPWFAPSRKCFSCCMVNPIYFDGIFILDFKKEQLTYQRFIQDILPAAFC